MTHNSDFVARQLRRAGEAIFGSADEFARNQGCQAGKGRSGLSRSDRHPQLESAGTVPTVFESRESRRAGRSRCAGTGQITLRDRLLVLPLQAWGDTDERSL
jgi:hypothetical protein